MNFKTLNNLVGWIVFGIATVVYLLSAEPTGSLWDCGEFISSAYKLEVCHPPGAPLFLMVGRLFAWLADVTSSNPADIAYAVNALSGICTAFMVLFVFWFTTGLAKLIFVGREGELTERGDIIAVLGSGAVAGLTAAFAVSVWFSAVEGEVYAMSAFFTGLTMWAMMRWFLAADNRYSDRWLVFTAYVIGLSIGVHLLSLLTLPMIAMMYYYKKNKNPNLLGVALSFGAGFMMLVLVQYFIIPRIPAVGASFDRAFVNSFGLPFGTGLVFWVLTLSAMIIGGMIFTQRRGYRLVHEGLLYFSMVLIGFSTYGLIVLRANANTPINMNKPSDAYSLLSYLNREQYGDRPLFYGPSFASERDPQNPYNIGGDVWRPVGEEYKKVDEKVSLNYTDNMLFPRLGHMDENRATLYRMWLNLPEGAKPSMGDNLSFFFRYQIGWMYVRYFMWNFVGRQNADQGFYSWDPTKGNWISGIGAIDNARLFDQSNMPERWKNDPGRNAYFFLPLIFGLLGAVFHFRRRPQEALITLVLFVMTGLAIIMFLNQPPSEPRERDYGFAGSIFTFAIWVGLAVPFFYSLMKEQLKAIAAIGSTALVLIAPSLMLTQNWDDMSRAHHYGARDYAANFLNSLAPNAILFTYGDNDTYPLWYAQEVEGIRTDVRVVNFSLLAVDWYINQLRRKMNDSPAIKMTHTEDAIRGGLRNILYINPERKSMNLADAIKFMAADNPRALQGGQQIESFCPTDTFIIPVPKDVAALKAKNIIDPETPDSLLLSEIKFGWKARYLTKDEIALLDIISNNIWERPIYYAVTCRSEKVKGLSPYLQLEGMGLRIVPTATPADPTMPGIMSYGRVATDKIFKLITEDFRWGNFDKRKMFVDNSYLPSVNSIQMLFIRTCEQLLREGKKEQAGILAETYFKAFPDFNFPYDENNGALMIKILLDAGKKEAAKTHLEIYLARLKEKLDYFKSLGQSEILDAAFGAPGQQRSQALASLSSDLKFFGEDYLRGKQSVAQMQNIVSQAQDPDLEAVIKPLADLYGRPMSPPQTPQAPPTAPKDSGK